MPLENQDREQVKGFAGAVAGLPLSDVLQLKGHNRFSGRVTVEYAARNGSIFFRDGEIIHAELEEASGEEALYAILGWPGGSFAVHPKITTTDRSIQANLTYLLLEAHRRQDEGIPSSRQALPPQETERPTTGNVARSLLAIDGVSHAVVHDREGTPLGDDTVAGAALAGFGIAVAKFGEQLEGLFGVGPLRGAAWQGSTRQFLLFESKKHYLAVAVCGENRIEQVEADIRSALTPRR